ncbi:hypothetical protein [Embleya sp. NBC_00896]|uniref:hypothetical protein n=1 Tax=Embleya sp. NBC_00896 TaxID=2975961 RepID=UPI00386913D8|nr:hypothetical protein OG928_14140 [Embleya sp. NBC_00896]
MSDNANVPRFVCDRCRIPVTGFLVRVPLPAPTLSRVPPLELDLAARADARRPLPRMPRGAYAHELRYDRDLLRDIAILGPDAEYPLPPLGFKIHPDEASALVTHTHRDDWACCLGCCGPSGHNGPNLACPACGTEVATLEADCYTQNEVTLSPAAVALSFLDD